MGKWEMVRLGDVCELKAGKFISASEIKNCYDAGLFPCYGGNGIRGYVEIFTHEGEYPLIGRQGALCGNIQYAHGKFYATEHAIVTRPKTDLDIQWLCYKLKELNLNKYAVGAAQPGLTVEKLNNIPLSLPPLHIQQKIADILNRTATLIEKRKVQIAKLNLLVKSQFIQMFGDPATNPMAWKNSTIGESCYHVKDGPHVSPKYVADGTGVPFISTRNLAVCNGIDWSTAKYISEADYEVYAKRCKPEKGDVLYTKGGTTGIARYVDTDRIFANWVHLAVLKFDNRLNGLFFEYMLNSDYCYKQSQVLTKGITNKDLVLGSMKQIHFFVPPIDLQNRFADFVCAVDKSRNEMQGGLATLETIYKALMQKCFNREMFNKF
jgi:type I restriction enzyme S subunit